MTVHAILNDEANKALKDITSQLKSYNPTLNKFQNALISLAVVELKDSLNEARIKAISEKLLSRSGKRKILASRMATLMQSLDENSFHSMETGLKKILNQFEKDGPPSKGPIEVQRKNNASMKSLAPETK